MKLISYCGLQVLCYIGCTAYENSLLFYLIFIALEVILTFNYYRTILANGSFHISSFQNQDEGLYQCQAFDETGSILSRSANLESSSELVDNR